LVKFALPYGALARKPALRCTNRKGNNHHLMLRLALVSELAPDKASWSNMGILSISPQKCINI